MDWESRRNAERGIGGELAMAAYMEHKDLANESIGPERTRQITDGVHRVLDRIAEAERAAGREADPCGCSRPPKPATSGKSWRQSTPACG